MNPQPPKPAPAPKPQDKRPSNWQDVQDEKARKKEEAAPTTKTEMGKPFAKGGALKARINRQDTKHGKVDMPFTKLTKFAGMRQGGKVKRYAEGGGISEEQNPNIDDETRSKALSWASKKSDDDSSKPAEGKSFKEAFREARQGGAKTFSWRGKSYTTDLAKPKVAAPAKPEVKRASPPSFPTAGAMADKISGMPQFRKGGIMKYRAGGKIKEAQMEERHAGAMKKAGLPKSMIREEQAEAKKYAKGGGIESRGKTKGTVVRMAKGGSVRGAGCETRGKTKGRMV